MSKPSGGIRSFLAVRLGLPTPIVALAGIGNVIFRCFLVQAGNFILYGVCKFVFLGSPLGELSPQVTEGLPATAANRFHKELRFFFSLLKRKKKQKKKRVRILPVLQGQVSPEDYTSTKLPQWGEQAAAAAVTLLFLQLKLGRKVSGDLLSLSKSAVAISAGRWADSPRKKEKNSHSTCTIRQMHRTKCCLVIF